MNQSDRARAQVSALLREAAANDADSATAEMEQAERVAAAWAAEAKARQPDMGDFNRALSSVPQAEQNAALRAAIEAVRAFEPRWRE